MNSIPVSDKPNSPYVQSLGCEIFDGRNSNTQRDEYTHKLKRVLGSESEVMSSDEFIIRSKKYRVVYYNRRINGNSSTELERSDGFGTL